MLSKPVKPTLGECEVETMADGDLGPDPSHSVRLKSEDNSFQKCDVVPAGPIR